MAGPELRLTYMKAADTDSPALRLAELADLLSNKKHELDRILKDNLPYAYELFSRLHALKEQIPAGRLRNRADRTMGWALTYSLSVEFLCGRSAKKVMEWIEDLPAGLQRQILFVGGNVYCLCSKGQAQNVLNILAGMPDRQLKKLFKTPRVKEALEGLCPRGRQRTEILSKMNSGRSSAIPMNFNLHFGS